jgi:ABC-type nitrate/sulfonate/bicarbonate transport system ATPase subunit
MPGEPALDALVVAKTFVAPGGTPQTILRDVHLIAAPGEIVALLGHSGIGKSTLLRIVLGLDTKFQGRILAPAGPTGVVFQDSRLLPWLTVAENLRLVMPRGTTGRRIEDLLERASIAGTAHHLPAELSLGMTRRVALARALAVDPTLLVLDEPFASLDPLLGATLANRVADHARRTGCVVLLATHELEHALAVADHIFVMTGRPATATAIAVPGRNDPDVIDRLRTDLLNRFRFLAAPAAS